MIINQEGMRYTYNGMTYTVGAAVMATEASEYQWTLWHHHGDP